MAALAITIALMSPNQHALNRKQEVRFQVHLLADEFSRRVLETSQSGKQLDQSCTQRDDRDERCQRPV